MTHSVDVVLPWRCINAACSCGGRHRVAGVLPGRAALTEVDRRTMVLHGRYEAPPRWDVVPQRGDGLAQRLANAFTGTARDAWQVAQACRGGALAAAVRRHITMAVTA